MIPVDKVHLAALLFLLAPPGSLRRVYRGAALISDLAVGDDHVAAYDAQARGIRWWRGSGRYPSLVAGAFRSLVSGDGFPCAVEDSSKVRCWGPSGSAVQAAFAKASLSSLAAGGYPACGVDSFSGQVLWSARSSPGALAQSDLYPRGLAREGERSRDVCPAHRCADPRGAARATVSCSQPLWSFRARPAPTVPMLEAAPRPSGPPPGESPRFPSVWAPSPPCSPACSCSVFAPTVPGAKLSLGSLGSDAPIR